MIWVLTMLRHLIRRFIRNYVGSILIWLSSRSSWFWKFVSHRYFRTVSNDAFCWLGIGIRLEIDHQNKGAHRTVSSESIIFSFIDLNTHSVTIVRLSLFSIRRKISPTFDQTHIWAWTLMFPMTNLITVMASWLFGSIHRARDRMQTADCHRFDPSNQIKTYGYCRCDDLMTFCMSSASDWSSEASARYTDWKTTQQRNVSFSQKTSSNKNYSVEFVYRLWFTIGLTRIRKYLNHIIRL